MTIFLTLFILFLYFIPTFAAYGSQHKDRVAILVVNFFLGWTFIGWVIALVWAAKKPADKPNA